MADYTYKTTWTKGMNTRPKPNVNNAPNGSVAFGAEVDGVELWTALSDGVNVKRGDTWMRLDDPVEKWVAVIHNGVVYGEVKVVGEEPEEPTPETPVFPESFVMTDPKTNKSAEYVFVRIVD